MFNKQAGEKQNVSIKLLEELVTLECDKILQTIFFKA